MERVAVIGAGVAGLASAKVLKQDGFAVTVFDKDEGVGGVWAASRAYPGLRTNNPAPTYAFSDFPPPRKATNFPRPASCAPISRPTSSASGWARICAWAQRSRRWPARRAQRACG